MLMTSPANYDTIFYRVRSGDSLNKIIHHYHGSVTTQQRNDIISQIQADNPEVKNPDHIFPNQLLQISIPQRYCSATTQPEATPTLNVDHHYFKPLQKQWQHAAPQERDMLSTLTPIMLGTGSASMTMVNRTFSANTPLLNELVQNYETYKAGDLSKGQYDYRRYKILAKLKARLGPLSRILNTTRLQREVLRISKTRGRAPTHNITRQIGRMGRLGKYASHSGVVLSGVGLGIACNDIANTNGMLKKNEILVENVGGIIGGAAVGLVVLFMPTPAGWVAALVVGVAGAVAGFTAGKITKKIYTTSFSRVDVASMTRVAQLCKK